MRLIGLCATRQFYRHKVKPGSNHAVHNRQQWDAVVSVGEPIAMYVVGDKDPVPTWVHPKTDKIR